MKLSIVISTVLLAAALGGCDRFGSSPTVVAVPVPVAVPGPAGATGATGATGDTGAKGEPGKTGSTVVVIPK